MIQGVHYTAHFIADPANYLTRLLEMVDWDNRMKARKTASYGVAYNYSQIHYPDRPFLPDLASLLDPIEAHIGFRPNNCLINLYEDGQSSMGFHSDQTDILESGTGVAILSLGATRLLRFREITDKSKLIDYPLIAGSLLYMDQAVQHQWQHAIPRAEVKKPRISLTFRRILC